MPHVPLKSFIKRFFVGVIALNLVAAGIIGFYSYFVEGIQP